MNLNDLEGFLRKELVIQTNDARFVIEFPSIIRDAELRCYREVDFEHCRRVQNMTLGAPPQALIALPPTCLVPLSIAWFTPVGTTTKRNPLDCRQADYLRDYWPDQSITAPAGKFWGMQGEHSILLAPTLDAAYKLEIWFTERKTSIIDVDPSPGAAGTQTTVLATKFEDLLKAAAAVRTCGFLKNFGAQSEDPKVALSWESTYQRVLGPVIAEEKRKKTVSWALETPSQPPESSAVN